MFGWLVACVFACLLVWFGVWPVCRFVCWLGNFFVCVCAVRVFMCLIPCLFVYALMCLLVCLCVCLTVSVLCVCLSVCVMCVCCM